MTHTHTPAEWAAFLSLGVSAWAAMAAVIWLTADAELEDFDPRPAVRRALQSPAADRVLIAVGPALHDARQATRHALREAALTVAALLILTIPTGDHR